jgi:hypothetical protein
MVASVTVTVDGTSGTIVPTEAVFASTATGYRVNGKLVMPDGSRYQVNGTIVRIMTDAEKLASPAYLASDAGQKWSAARAAKAAK